MGGYLQRVVTSRRNEKGVENGQMDSMRGVAMPFLFWRREGA